MPNPVVFVDQTGASSGSALNAANLDALIPAQSYLISGGLISNGASLTPTQPATVVVVNTGSTTGYLSVGSTGITLTATRDNYVDLSNAGSYTVSPVTIGAGAPSQAAGTIRLYFATTNGSNVTAVVQLAPSQAVGPDSISPDTAEASTLDTITAGASTFRNTVNRIRNAIKTLAGAAVTGGWLPTKAAMMFDGTNSSAATLAGGTTLSGGATVSGGSLALGANGITATNYSVSGAGAATFSSLAGHVASTGSVPTYTLGASALVGTGASVTHDAILSDGTHISNTDLRGAFDIVLGTGISQTTPGTLITVNFAAAFAFAPFVDMRQTLSNGTVSSTPFLIGAVTTAGFTVNVGWGATLPGSGTTYSFRYIAMA